MDVPIWCPSCGKSLAFRQIVLTSDQYAIRCNHCGTRLAKQTRGYKTAAAGTAFVVGLGSSYGWLSWQTIASAVTVFGAVAVIAITRARVSIAGDDVPDRPSRPTPARMGDTPPPLEPTFRGMSGPPPKDDA